MRIVWAALLAIALLGAVAPAGAQNYPTKPISIVVPFPPGATDIFVRFLQPTMEKDLGKPLLLETRSGANGYIGTEYVARAAPDGYTLLVNITSSIVMGPLLSPDVKFDVERDFAPISGLAYSPWIWVVRKGLPVETFSDFVAYAKANPGKVTYGTPGAGSIPHVLSASLARSAGVELTHVPYRGFMAIMQALSGGEVDAMMITLSTARPLLAKGDVKALAYDEGEAPEGLSNLPAMVKVAPGFERLLALLGLWAPANTPKPIIDRLNKSVRDAAAVPENRAKLMEGGNIVIVGTPEEWGAMVAANQVAAKKIVGTLKAAGIKFD